MRAADACKGCVQTRVYNLKMLQVRGGGGGRSCPHGGRSCRSCGPAARRNTLSRDASGPYRDVQATDCLSEACLGSIHTLSLLA